MRRRLAVAGPIGALLQQPQPAAVAAVEWHSSARAARAVARLKPMRLRRG